MMMSKGTAISPEKPAVAEWSSPVKKDPFATSVEENIELLLRVDAELRADDQVVEVAV